MIISIALIAAVVFFELSAWALVILIVTGCFDVIIVAIIWRTREPIQPKEAIIEKGPKITQYFNPFTREKHINFGYHDDL